MSSIYGINKGINKPIEFKGLKAQYIIYLAIGLIVVFMLFACMYVIGVNLIICLLTVGGMGASLFMSVYHLSRKYGQYGLVKKLAARQLPIVIRTKSRKVFHYLNKQPV